ncbi:hypothetical protein JCM8547_007541 [Rhodosporidiobolus lusitaniae]
MWQAVLQDENEKQAFHALLAQYFQQPFPASPSSSSSPPLSASSPAPPPAQAPPPVFSGRSLPPPAPATRTASFQAPKQAPSLAPTGHEPRRPAGLESSKTTAGGFNASSKKSFAKDLFASKGPMNRAEMEKKKDVGPLFVKSAVQSKPHVPPPRRAPVPGTGGVVEERVRALYEYEGAEAEDLPVVEGEEVVVLEHVSSNWFRCRNAAGSTGLIPASYVQAV